MKKKEEDSYNDFRPPVPDEKKLKKPEELIKKMKKKEENIYNDLRLLAPDEKKLKKTEEVIKKIETKEGEHSYNDYRPPVPDEKKLEKTEELIKTMKKKAGKDSYNDFRPPVPDEKKLEKTEELIKTMKKKAGKDSYNDFSNQEQHPDRDPAHFETPKTDIENQQVPELRMIFEEQNLIHSTMRELSGKFDELLEQQKRLLSMVSQLGGSGVVALQGSVGAGGAGDQPIAMDTIKRHEVDPVFNSQNKLMQETRTLHSQLCVDGSSPAPVLAGYGDGEGSGILEEICATGPRGASTGPTPTRPRVPGKTDRSAQNKKCAYNRGCSKHTTKQIRDWVVKPTCRFVKPQGKFKSTDKKDLVQLQSRARQ